MTWLPVSLAPARHFRFLSLPLCRSNGVARPSVSLAPRDFASLFLVILAVAAFNYFRFFILSQFAARLRRAAPRRSTRENLIFLNI